MTSNGFVVASCAVKASANAPGDGIIAKARIEVNNHAILSLTKETAMGGSLDTRTTLCFPVKKGDTVFVFAGGTHSGVGAGGSVSGDVSATFFPCL